MGLESTATRAAEKHQQQAAAAPYCCSAVGRTRTFLPTFSAASWVPSTILSRGFSLPPGFFSARASTRWRPRLRRAAAALFELAAAAAGPLPRECCCLGAEAQETVRPAGLLRVREDDIILPACVGME